jgi:hypothetical protein
MLSLLKRKRDLTDTVALDSGHGRVPQISKMNWRKSF